MWKLGVRGSKWNRSSYQSPHLMGNQNCSKSELLCELFMLEDAFKVLVALPVSWNIYSVVLVEFRRFGPRCVIFIRSWRRCGATAETTKEIIHCYGSSCRICHLWALLHGLFCIELPFTWETSVQVHHCASCQLSNSGTKAWREVASHYGTSVKNAGSIFRASEIDSALRQGKQRCGRQRWNSISASSFILLGCTRPFLPVHHCLIGEKLSFTFVLLLSIIHCTDKQRLLDRVTGKHAAWHVPVEARS